MPTQTGPADGYASIADEYISAPELADVMGLNRQNVYDRMKTGRLDAVELGPRAKVIRRDVAIAHFQDEARRHAKYAKQLERGLATLGAVTE